MSDTPTTSNAGRESASPRFLPVATPGGSRLYFRETDGAQVCGQLLDQSGERCPVSRKLDPATGRCGRHAPKARGGGARPAPGRPPERRRWQRVAGRFHAALQEAQADPELLDVQRPAAISDVLLADAAARYADGDCPAWRLRVLEQAHALEAAAGDAPPELRGEVAELARLVAAGADEVEREQYLRTAAERHAKVVGDVHRLRLAAAVTVNARDLAAIFAKLCETLQSAGPGTHDIPRQDVGAWLVERVEATLETLLGDSVAAPTGRRALPVS